MMSMKRGRVCVVSRETILRQGCRVSRESSLQGREMFHVSRAVLLLNVSRESLSDTELRENRVEQVLNIDFPGDTSQSNSCEP